MSRISKEQARIYRERYRHREEMPHRRYSKAKSRAKYKGKTFNLTEAEFTELITKPCHYCNGYFEPTKTCAGLDRIDNDRGYELGNVLPCCGSCNRTRGDRFTVEETIEIIKMIISRRASHGKI